MCIAQSTPGLLPYKAGFIVMSIILLFTNCATYKKQLNEAEKIPSIENPIAHRFYLIGDAGYANGQVENKLFKQIKDSLDRESNPTTVLFLGDNIYPKGLPKKSSKKRQRAEFLLQSQIDVVKDRNIRHIFIPGNHDWYNDGLKGLKRQERFVEDQLGKNSFLPQNGCPIEKENISEDIVLILIDAQWYIENWDKHPTLNDNCEIKSRAKFLSEVNAEIKKARGKTTLIAMHHPIFSDGPHGGKFSLQDHLKPLPVLGTLKNFLRKTTGLVNADLTNRHYNELRNKLITMAKQNEKVIFVSGHEHSLQYLVQENIHQIISGSGSKETPTKASRNSIFTYGTRGFAILDVHENGTSKVKFISRDKVEFQTTLFKEEKALSTAVQISEVEDSVANSIYTKEEVSKSKFHEFLWGDRFRDQYGIPIKAEVLYLDSLKGGLTPFRRGGGTQSKSLHLKDAEGKRYVIRALKKEAVQFIQSAIFVDQYLEDELQNSALEKLVLDVFTGSYPYAPLLIGQLSDSIHLAHLNPALYYIPKQPALGKYNTEFGDELYLFEEHASEGHLHLGGEFFTGEIISTDDMLDEILSDESKKIDEQEFIKARLFDMLIGDWDRHQDQWRWMEYKENNETIYKPLPRDRDQPFSRMSDGLLFGAAVKLLPPSGKKLKKYNENIAKVEHFNFSPLPLDIALFEKLDKEEWDRQAAYIQSRLTDDVIDQAFLQLPQTLSDQTLEEIKSTLKKRRSHLQEISDNYFDYLSKRRILKTTHKDDYILIEANKHGELNVRFSRIIKGSPKRAYFQKKFFPKKTKEIWIYGLDDDDVFEVKGKSTAIKLILIGGQNNDTYSIEQGKNIWIYDFKSKKNTVQSANGAKVKLRDDYDLNTYNYHKRNYMHNKFVPKLSYNPDNGYQLGGSLVHKKYGFETNPFTNRQLVEASFFSATSGIELTYQNEIANFINNSNLLLDASYNTPKSSINFFGFGNETINLDEEKGLDYNRVLLEQFTIHPKLKWKSYGGSGFSAGIKYQTVNVARTLDRFISENDLAEKLIKAEQFGSISLDYHFENKNYAIFPTNGIKAGIHLSFTQNLDKEERHFFSIVPELTFINKLSYANKAVLVSRLKAHLITSDQFEFYQAATIGGDDGLRGFRNQRFTAKHSFYHSTDFRYAMGALRNQIVPLEYGFFLGFDYGRVWSDEISSKKWHNSQGTGIFLNLAGSFGSTLGLFNSVEGFRLYFNLGLDF